MNLNVFGGVHIIYLLITLPLSVIGLYFAKKYAKSEKSQEIVLKSIAVMLFVWIVINRISQVFRYSTVQWELIIPDSFCGMTSLVLSLSVLFGKKDNAVYHFVWLLGIVGALFLFKQIYVTYKKWYCTLFGFTAYLTVGAFQMAVFGFEDAFHIAKPLLEGTPLTAWVAAPIYAAGYAIVLLIIELVRKQKHHS